MVTVGALVALCACPGAAVADRRSTEVALERHRPVLRYDSRERYFAQPVGAPLGTPRVRPGQRVHGHLAREGGQTWLQYWLFYAYNPQDRGVVGTGRHQGDWELVQLRLGRNGSPEVATLVQHSWAEGCPWAELERVRSGGSEVPVIYVANGSHANYAHAGTYDRPFPDPNDEADGRGRRVRPQLQAIDDSDPSWVRWAGRWGTSRAGIVPGEQSSPRGPRFQEHDAWRRPASFYRERARRCGSGAPDRPWQTPAGVGLALAIAVGVVLGVRGRSNPHRRRQQ